MKNSTFTPKFAALSQVEEELLTAKLQAVRKSIAHSGEKGRSLEIEVANFLRNLLPTEYGISTGFVVYHGANGPSLSPQLDIIIYDAIRSGPIAKLATCEVFPLEAVYAYIEVKSSIRSSDATDASAENSIERCLEINKALREMRLRKYWRSDGGSPSTQVLHEESWLAIRSYVFAFEAQGNIAKDAGLFAKRMASVSKKLGPPIHLHGVFIAGQGYFFTRPIDVRNAQPDDYFHVKFVKQHALTVFKVSLLNALASFRRIPENWTPAIEQYYDIIPEITEVTPD